MVLFLLTLFGESDKNLKEKIGFVMDIASLIGFLGAIGMILGAMISGGGVAPFIDVPSILIVFGGTFFAVMYTAPLPVFLGSFGVMAKAFHRRIEADPLYLHLEN